MENFYLDMDQQFNHMLRKRQVQIGKHTKNKEQVL